jgi:hypothetical protein
MPTYADYLTQTAGKLAYGGLAGSYKRRPWQRQVGRTAKLMGETTMGATTETPWGQHFAYQSGLRLRPARVRQQAREIGYTRKKKRFGRVKRRHHTTGAILVERRQDPASKEWTVSQRQVMGSLPGKTPWIGPGYGTWHRLATGAPQVETSGARRRRLRAISRPGSAEKQFSFYGLQVPGRLRPEEQAISFMTSGSDMIMPNPGQEA